MRLIFFAVTLFTLYILWPSLIVVFRSWPQLLTLNPVWYPVMVALEAASFMCAWGLQRLALSTDRWFAIATAQLGGNAVSRVVPGGAAAGGATQFKMLDGRGIPAARVGRGSPRPRSSARAPCSRCPCSRCRRPSRAGRIPSELAPAALLGGLLFVVGFVAGWVLFRSEGALRGTGRAMQWVRNRVLRKRAPHATSPTSWSASGT